MGYIYPTNIKIKNDYKQSPLFVLVPNSDINANGIYAFKLGTQPYSSYLPFNYLVISNNSSSPFYVWVNDSVKMLINQGTIQTFDYKTFPAIRTLKIQNAGSTTISKDSVQVMIQKSKIRWWEK